MVFGVSDCSELSIAFIRKQLAKDEPVPQELLFGEEP